MYICGTCRQEVDPDGSNVIALRRWIPTEAFGGDVQWVEGVGEHFHRNHAPKLGLEWRAATNPPEGN